MQLIRISYKDFTFMVNPETLTIKHSKTVANRQIPFSLGKNKEMGTNPVTITGSGYFAGENARKNIRTLSSVFDKKGSGYLFLPDSTPIKAIFSSLDISFAGAGDRIDYSFEFVQENIAKGPVYDFGFTYAMGGENLYDIANRTNVDVGTIFSLNSFSDLFSVQEGDKVWLG